MRRIVLVVLSVLLLGLVIRVALVSARNRTPSKARPRVVSHSPQPIQSTSAHNFGKIVYVQTIDKTPDGAADVFEFDLCKGTAKLIIPSNSMPVEYRALRPWLDVSPNGDYLLLEHGSWAIAHNGSDDGTRASKAPRPNAWIWERRTGQFHRLVKGSNTGVAFWSPTGRYLLYTSPGKAGTYHVYDADTRASRTFALPGYTDVRWSADDGHLLLCRDLGKRGSVVRVYELRRGVTRTVLSWKRSVDQIEPGLRGSVYAVSSALTQTYMVDMHPFKVRKVAIPIDSDDNDWLSSPVFSFSPDGRQLAVFSWYTFGEPHIETSEGLWSVNVASGKALEVACWSYGVPADFGDPEGVVVHHLLGWSSDSKCILVFSHHEWDSEDGYRSDRVRVRAIAVGSRKGEDRLLFESGEGCLALSWWPGPK